MQRNVRGIRLVGFCVLLPEDRVHWHGIVVDGLRIHGAAALHTHGADFSGHGIARGLDPPGVKIHVAAPPSQDVAGKYRTDEGGHLLLRPAGQEYFARAARVMMNRGLALKTTVSTLAKLPMTLGEERWRGVLWKEASSTMIPKNAKLAVELLLHLAGQAPDKKGYNLLKEYRKALDDKRAKLPALR